MRLFNLVNEELFKNRNVSLYLESETADELIDDILDSDEEFYEEYTEGKIMDTLDENDIVVVSRNVYENGEIEWFCEPLLINYKQFYNEADYIVIQDEIVDCIDMEKVNGEILTLYFEEEDIEEEVDELDIMLEEMTEDLLTDLSVEDNCCHCSIKEALELAYWSGFNDGVEEENQF